MKGLKNIHPAWIATVIAIAALLWVLSGVLTHGPDTEADSQGAEKSSESVAVKVGVKTSRAAPVTREAVISGRTAPVRSVTVRAQTSGRVSAVVAERGGRIENGAVIARLALDDRRAQQRQAEAIRKQRQMQYEASKKLQAKGFQTSLDLAQAKANLESARAEVERIREDVGHTVIRAPFAGVLETRPVEQGDFVSVGDEIGRVIDQDKFIVRGSVSEDVIPYLETGQTGTVTLIDKRVVQGQLRYVATDANEQTRTYPVELEVENPGGRLISGASTEMRLPLEQVMAHEVEPAILTLSDQGEFGIKSVDENNRVHFHKAEIVRNRGGRVWLSELPNKLRIIKAGQGFVTHGDTVEVTSSEDDVAAGAAGEQGPGETMSLPQAQP